MKKMIMTSLLMPVILTGCLTTKRPPTATPTPRPVTIPTPATTAPIKKTGERSIYAAIYRSEPAAGSVYCNDRLQGIEPIEIVHIVMDVEVGDRLPLHDCKVVWESGAAQVYPSSVVWKRGETQKNFLALRPKNAEGLQEDINYANKIASTREAARAKEQALKQEAMERERQAFEREGRDYRYDTYEYQGNNGHAVYTIKNRNVYYGEKIIALDTSSFVDLGYGYAKDHRNVMYQGVKIYGLLAEYFEVLNFNYTKDITGAYYRGVKISNYVNARTFVALNANYAKDSLRVYYRDRVIEDATMRSFEVLDIGYAKDWMNVYYRGIKVEGANTRTFKAEGGGYGSDWRYRYYLGNQIP